MKNRSMEIGDAVDLANWMNRNKDILQGQTATYVKDEAGKALEFDYVSTLYVKTFAKKYGIVLNGKVPDNRELDILRTDVATLTKMVAQLMDTKNTPCAPPPPPPGDMFGEESKT